MNTGLTITTNACILVTWTRKGIPVSDDEHFQLRTNNDTHYLLIKKAVADVVGSYVVTAQNTAGRVSAEIDLNIAGESCLVAEREAVD